MRRLIVSALACVAMLCNALGATVYSRITTKPTAGWPNTYLIVYEVSDTKAYVWDGTDDQYNYTEVTIANGKITSDDLADSQVQVATEGSNYSVKAKDGYIWVEAKDNGIEFAKGAHECTIKVNGGYVQLETNTNTERFVYNTTAKRFRFYYDKDKKWANTTYKNVYFYILGDQEDPGQAGNLDINYAHASMYACYSKFPTTSSPYDQYFYTELFLAQEESYEAVPQVGLEILAPTQYSLVGEKTDTYRTYKSTYDAGNKGYINITNGAHHSYFWFPSKAEAGYSEAAIIVAEMKITRVGESKKPNAYVYHIKLEFTDSNKKIWKLDKDIDVYGWWSDCDRSGKELVDMDPVAFALESGNHNPQADVEILPESIGTKWIKRVVDGQIVIIRDGVTYNVLGVRL